TISAELSPFPVFGHADSDHEREVETFEEYFATGHCAYNGSQYGKNDMGLIKVELEVVLQPPSATERVGWMKFDTSTLPDSVEYTWVQLCYVVTYFEHSMGLAITCLNEDPITTGAQALYNAIYNSEVCAMGPMGRAVSYMELGPIAARHVQNSFSRGWVAFGMVGYDYSSIITKRGWTIGWNASPRENAPRLIVTYEPPSGVAEPAPVPDPAGFTVFPNPVSGGTATLRFAGKQVSGWSDGQVTVYDVRGSAVFSTRLTGHSAAGSVPLDLRALGPGVYLVRVEAGSFTATRKLVVK
ncbi:MAG: T9SS type A sorting domain-containing protein, partial [bacterium]